MEVSVTCSGCLQAVCGADTPLCCKLLHIDRYVPLTQLSALTGTYLDGSLRSSYKAPPRSPTGPSELSSQRLPAVITAAEFFGIAIGSWTEDLGQRMTAARVRLMSGRRAGQVLQLVLPKTKSIAGSAHATRT